MSLSTQIGVPNANTDKKERLITDEVESNNVETRLLGDLWLEELRKGCEEAREMFGIELNVDWRYPNETEVQTDGKAVDPGTE